MKIREPRIPSSTVLLVYHVIISCQIYYNEARYIEGRSTLHTPHSLKQQHQNTDVGPCGQAPRIAPPFYYDKKGRKCKTDDESEVCSLKPIPVIPCPNASQGPLTSQNMMKKEGRSGIGTARAVPCGKRQPLEQPWYWNLKGQKCKRLKNGTEACHQEIIQVIPCPSENQVEQEDDDEALVVAPSNVTDSSLEEDKGIKPINREDDLDIDVSVEEEVQKPTPPKSPHNKSFVVAPSGGTGMEKSSNTANFRGINPLKAHASEKHARRKDPDDDDEGLVISPAIHSVESDTDMDEDKGIKPINREDDLDIDESVEVAKKPSTPTFRGINPSATIGGLKTSENQATINDDNEDEGLIIDSSNIPLQSESEMDEDKGIKPTNREEAFDLESSSEEKVPKKSKTSNFRGINPVNTHEEFTESESGNVRGKDKVNGEPLGIPGTVDKDLAQLLTENDEKSEKLKKQLVKLKKEKLKVKTLRKKLEKKLLEKLLHDFEQEDFVQGSKKVTKKLQLREHIPFPST